MRKLIIGLLTVCLPSIASAAERVGDFTLLDHNGDAHSMSWYDDHDAVVFLTQANRCDSTREAASAFDTVRTRYADANFQFMMLNAEGSRDRDAVSAAAAEYGTDLPILMDDSQTISQAMEINQAGEVIVYDPKSFSIKYRGPVENYLTAALDQIAAGDEVSNPEVLVSGCEIAYEMTNEASISYADEVAPILADNCASCHRENGIAPFAMNSHQSVQGWSPMIREVVMTRRMPPGQIDPHVGEFDGAPGLTNLEVQKLINWIAAGSINDSANDPLTELTWPDTKWHLGEPDMIVKIPPQQIPATGVLDYRNLAVPLTELTESRWVRGSEVSPGDYGVVHHVIPTVIPPSGGIARGEGLNSVLALNPEVPTMAGYAPGYSDRMEKENTGALLEAGSTIVFQMHYTTSGKETVDETELGIYFYPEGMIPEERVSGRPAVNPNIAIPPGAKDHPISASLELDRDVYLQSVLPHMHFRGKRVKYSARFPDGTEQLLFNNPSYDFNWQLTYHFEDPVFLPAGTTIVVDGGFDNSAQNPFNPDPSINVYGGEQSWEEMFFGFMTWKDADQSQWTTQD
ncbi:MAG: redoxin domain-containing protein [Gammaproteobacteria bacterium]|nr:redoxin domain-containing protein [Gammaproteobacteria bacterium]